VLIAIHDSKHAALHVENKYCDFRLTKDILDFNKMQIILSCLHSSVMFHNIV